MEENKIITVDFRQRCLAVSPLRPPRRSSSRWDGILACVESIVTVAIGFFTIASFLVFLALL